MKSIREAVHDVIKERVLPWIEQDGISNLILPEQITPADCARPIKCKRICNYWHHEHELGIGLAGRALFCIDSKRFIFTPGRILLLPGGTPHRVIEANWLQTRDLDLDQPSSILWMAAHPFCVRIQVVHITSDGNVGKTTQPYILLEHHFSTLITWLLEKVRNRPPNYERIGRGILIEFMERCLGAATVGDEEDALRIPLIRRGQGAKRSRGHRNKSRPRPRRKPRSKSAKPDEKQVPGQVQQAQDFIHSNYHNLIGLAEIANAVDISANHLGQQFKAATGMTPVQYLINVRMEAAKQLLLTDLKAFEVGSLVGIEDPCYFSRLFRRFNGVTPLAYRRRMLKTAR